VQVIASARTVEIGFYWYPWTFKRLDILYRVVSEFNPVKIQG